MTIDQDKRELRQELDDVTIGRRRSPYAVFGAWVGPAFLLYLACGFFFSKGCRIKQGSIGFAWTADEATDSMIQMGTGGALVVVAIVALIVASRTK